MGRGTEAGQRDREREDRETGGSMEIIEGEG